MRMTAMKPIQALGIALPMALLLGAVLPAMAQEARTSFEGFGCVFDPDELVANGVIPAGAFPEGFAPVGFITSKNCPGSSPQPVIQLECEIPLDPDPDPDINISTRNFTCLINGAQCGFNQTFEGTNNRMTIASAVDINEDGEPVGRVTIRCSRNVTR
jgi:hypothetical protein